MRLYESSQRQPRWVDADANACYDPSHCPPLFVSVPAGKSYIHECPSCGRIEIIKGDVYR